ncbi:MULTISPECIES: hypothetical protein [Paenibacillus]|uniref:Uncharacterized protein n=1 Tax=Paenibacillus residui TaxID=629724 RepID=A0ABW3DEW1_9BACL|nr:hypothetical protein [Paenibacillus sp. 32O-W]
MRSLLITLLLLLAVILIFNSTVGGKDGTEEMVRSGGSRINSVIESINP